MAVDIAADRGEPRFGVEARRQFGQRRGGALVRSFRLGAVGVEAAVSLGQRRLSRGVAIDLALGIGMTLTPGIAPPLPPPPPPPPPRPPRPPALHLAFPPFH